MTDLAPVSTMGVRELAWQLGEYPFEEWLVYQGKRIINLNIDAMLLRDAEFQQFWFRRCDEEVRAFERILLEGDFLDVAVVDFFSVPDVARQFLRTPGSRTMREWVEMRLGHARDNRNRLLS